jgi:hypothetical protein
VTLTHRIKFTLTLSAIALITLVWPLSTIHQSGQHIVEDDRAALVHALTTINTFPEERLLTSEDQPTHSLTPLLAAEYVAEKLTGLDADAVRELAADPSRYFTVPIGSM